MITTHTTPANCTNYTAFVTTVKGTVLDYKIHVYDGQTLYGALIEQHRRVLGLKVQDITYIKELQPYK